jgi:hypothetical protein
MFCVSYIFIFLLNYNFLTKTFLYFWQIDSNLLTVGLQLSQMSTKHKTQPRLRVFQKHKKRYFFKSVINNNQDKCMTCPKKDNFKLKNQKKATFLVRS